jgi:glycosyltransferase involved in cell wall biosynthesis
MKIVFFAHPLFLGSQSMPRFVNMLAEGMKARGHEVSIIRPESLFSKLPIPGIKKWLGYIDQYIVFPRSAGKILKENGQDTLYVVTDHALGPYVPLLEGKRHVIHCHDFLAQRSAQGEISQNPTSVTGRIYQNYIRSGYTKGKNFVSVSYKTQEDLHDFLKEKPAVSDVIYNGLNACFKPGNVGIAREALAESFKLDLKKGYILHVGGNQWYKNRIGVIEIYTKWRQRFSVNIPLLLIGNLPSPSLQKAYEQSDFKSDIHFLSGINDEQVQLAYRGASVFIFPSIAEGFGWPIAEAMASGTLVITTDNAPMTEVAGNAAFLIPVRPTSIELLKKWQEECAELLNNVIVLDDATREIAVEKGLRNAQRFSSEDTLNNIEILYSNILKASL